MSEEGFKIGAIEVRLVDRPARGHDLAPDKAAVSGDFLVNARTGRLVVLNSDGTLTLAGGK